MKHFRKVSAVLLALLMVAVILPSTGLLSTETGAAEVGVITNGDFSQTETLQHASGGSWVHALYWEQYEWGATVTGGAVKFTKDSSTAGHVSLSQVVAVNTNATYTLSFKVKGGTGGCNVATTPCITYKVLGGTRGDACNASLKSGTPSTESSSYKTNSYTIQTGSYKYIEIQFINTGTGDNDSYLDDVTLTVVNAGDTGTHAKPSFVDFGNELNRPKNSSSNVVTQPSFESTTSAPWNVSSFIKTNLSVINHSDAKDGSKVLYYSNPSTTGTWHTFDLDLPSGGNYVLSAWVKSPYLSKTNQGKASIGLIDPDTNMFFMSGLANYKGHTSTPFMQLRSTATDNKWHLRSMTFFVGAAGTVKIGVYGEQSELYIDDISVHLVENGVVYTGNQTGTISASSNTSNMYCEAEDNLIEDCNMTGAVAQKYWTTNASGWNNGFLSFENETLKFTGTGASGKKVYSYIKWIYVTPNTKYTVSYDYRITAKGSGQLRFIDNNVDLPQVFNTLSFSSTTSDWKTTSFTFNSGNYNRIGIMFTDGTGTALFDDFRIFKTADGISTEPEEEVFPTLQAYHPEKGVSRMEMTAGKLGLAFMFKLDVAEWYCNETASTFADGRFKIDYANSKVEAFSPDPTKYKLVMAGAVMTNDEMVGQNPDIFNLDNVKTDKTVIDIKAEKSWTKASTYPDTLTYVVRIVNIPEAYKGTLIYARPYYIFELADGRQVTVYGDVQFESYEPQKDVNDGTLDWD